jgi:cytochrome P450
LLNDPADIKHVLVDAAARYEKTPKLTSDRGRVLSGSGLHTATGLDHVFLRRMVQPLFHRRIVEGHADMVRRVTEQAMAGWRAGETVDLLDAMLKLTQQIMLRALFGESFVDERGRFADAVTVRRAYIEYFFTSNLPRPEHWPLPLVRRYRTARRHMGAVIDREITRRREAGAVGDDWLSMLVTSTGRDGTPLTDAQIRDEAITLTSTGYETVAAALTWAGHLLSTHADVQHDVHAELAADETPHAPLTTRVLNESMRLYPPTWLFVRVATSTDTLPGGAVILASDQIYLCPFTMHRHPDWYAQPDRFDPEHFTDEAVRARPRFAFFPFGGGARQCIGEPFARLEAQVVLSTLLRRFHLESLVPNPVPLRPSIVLEPRGGLRVRLHAAA